MITTNDMVRFLSTKTVVPAALLLMALSGCAVPYQPEEPAWHAPEADSLLVNVAFSVSGNESTKVTGVTYSDESAIARWALFAFDSRSGHFRWESSDSETPLTLQLISGRRYNCYAIVNYPLTGTGAFDPSSVRTPDDLTEKVAYLGDNRRAALLMFGCITVTPSLGAAESVTIRVKRLVSRLDLRGLSVDFSAQEHLAGKTFTLRAVYVTNAYRTSAYGYDYFFSELSESRQAWYNTGGWHRGETPESGMDALLGDTGINTVIAAGNPYTVRHSFYTFPNPTGEADDVRTMGGWTRRCTRLVIEASLGSDIVYYAITAPEMERNCIYAASNVIIRGKGSKDPEIIDIDPDIIVADIVPLIDDSWDGAGLVVLD